MTVSLSDCTDAELAALALGGRQTAYSELMRRYRDPIYRLVRAQVGDADEALDVTLECFISAFAALARFDRTRPFRVWVSRIAINKCRDWARRRSVRRFFTFALPIDAASRTADSAPAPDVAMADQEEWQRLSTAIAQLPLSVRQPLLLCSIEGLSQAEAAQVLNISEKAVETRIYRARSKLSEILRG